MFDTYLIYRRAIGSRCIYSKIFVTRTCPCSNIKLHSGVMRVCTAESVRKKLLQSEVSVRNIKKEKKHTQ